MTLDLFRSDFFKHSVHPVSLRASYNQAVFGKSLASGKDGITASKFSDIVDYELHLISRKILDGSYKPTRYRQRLIVKSAEVPPREVAIPTIRDRIAIRAAHEALRYHYSEELQRRPHRIVDDVKAAVSKADENSVFLRMDIKNFYPSIDRDLLIKKLRADTSDELLTNFISRVIQTPTGSREEVDDTGIPQGLSVSNMLAHIYLLDFDKSARELLDDDASFYSRYVDDILIICCKSDAKTLFNEFSELLSEYKLFCHDLQTSGKSEIRGIDDQIDYLGYSISSNSVIVRRKSLKKLYRSLAHLVNRANKEAATLTLLSRSDKKYKRVQKQLDRAVFRLNLRITGCFIDLKKRLGWVQYFSRIDKLYQLKLLDAFVRENISESVIRLGSEDTRRFIRTYYELAYNSDTTTYIPSFTKYTQEQKMEFIALMTDYHYSEVSGWDDEEIDAKFFNLVNRETSKLEQDLDSVS